MTPPATQEHLQSVLKRDKLDDLLAIGPTVDNRYLHWEELRYRRAPEDLTVEEWWVGVKLARQKLLKPIPLHDTEGRPFQYATPDHILESLHVVDRQASGGIQMSEEITNPSTRDRYIINSLMEESITSSQLEGAATTTEAAKELLRSGRPPRTRDERMIVNNYGAMSFIRGQTETALTPELVLELHRIVTEDTLDDPSKAGRFREDSDRILVQDPKTGTVLHVPPRADELPSRLAALCDFATAKPQGAFLHPVVRAIILHFWLAHDHPFVDGNGRTARAVFYWSMLAQGYWLAEYISVSRILKGAPAQYARSFLYSETDENDLTYFLEYHLKVICRSIEDLQQYLERKISEVREVEALLRQSADLNHRQLALLGNALRHPGQVYTIDSHRRSQNVVYQTARTDLFDLTDRGLLDHWKRGRRFVFAAPADLGERLQGLRHASGTGVSGR